MTTRIELIYDADCPNAPAARESVRKACVLAGLEPQWQEWDRAADDAPSYASLFGSPTVLVDGKDVAGEATESNAQSCRVYQTPDGKLTGTPTAEMIATYLSSRTTSDRTWVGGVTAVGAGLSGLLPVLTCPACWPAYAGILGALGLSFVNYTPYVLPVVIILLVATLTSLAMGIAKRGYGPFGVGVVASVALVTGRFASSSASLTYVAAAGLIAASIWNAWPRSRVAALVCHACTK